MTSHISSVMGFLTTSLHKNCQNDVKLLETWWFWPILGKVERAELTCDVIKKSCSTFLIKFWLYYCTPKYKNEILTFMANSCTLSPAHTGWVWASTRPGTMVFPLTSRTRSNDDFAYRFSISASGPKSLMFPCL